MLLLRVDFACKAQAVRYANRSPHVIVPGKPDPAEIKRSPQLGRVHLAEASSDADLGLNADYVEEGYKSARESAGDKIRFTPVPTPRQRRRKFQKKRPLHGRCDLFPAVE